MIKNTVLKDKFNKPIKAIIITILMLCFLTPSISYAVESESYQKEELANLNAFSNTAIMTGLSNYSGPIGLDLTKYEQVGIDKLYGLLPKRTIYYGEVPRLSIKDEDGKGGEVQIVNDQGQTIQDLENLKEQEKIDARANGSADDITIEGIDAKYDSQIKELKEKSGNQDQAQLSTKSSKNFENKAYSKISYYVGAGYRSYTSDTPHEGQGIFEYIKYKDGDENGPYSDLHLYGLTRQNSIFDSGFKELTGNLLPSLIGALYGIFNGITSFMIFVCNFDISTLSDHLFNGLKDNISKMFLINDGSLSPLLMVATVIFIVGIVTLIVRRFLVGEGSAQAIVQEFCFLILAAVLVGVSLGGGIDALQLKVVDLGNTLVKAVTTGEQKDNVLDLYQYKSNNSNDDLINTQIAISNKPYIDTIIASQFGVNVNDLEINEENFGSKAADISNKIVKNGEVLSVKNGPSGSSVKNLGYYWYCADSTVNVNDPYNQSNGLINHANPNNTVFVIDFLAALDASDEANPAVHVKAQEIVKRFNDPSIDSLRLFLVSILQLANALASGCIAIFTIIAKLIFYVGLLAVPVFPILLLIPKTRTKAKDLLVVWLVSALKMVVGMLILTLMLTFSAILCNQGDITGVLIAIAFTIGMVVLAPNIFIQLNNVFSQYEGKLGITRAANNMTGRAFSKITSARRGRFDKAYKGIKDHKNKVAKKLQDESKQEELDKGIEEAYTNIDLNDPDFLNDFTGSGMEDGFLSNDSQYQLDRMKLTKEAEDEYDDSKKKYFDKFNEMKKSFNKKDPDRAIKEIYNYQHISDLISRGKTDSREYKDLVKEQLAMERGVKIDKITDQDVTNFKLNSDKEKFYNTFDYMTKEDKANELAAIKSKTSIKGFAGKESDYKSKFLGKEAELKLVQNAGEDWAKKRNEIKKKYKNKLAESKVNAIERASTNTNNTKVNNINSNSGNVNSNISSKTPTSKITVNKPQTTNQPQSQPKQSIKINRID